MSANDSIIYTVPLSLASHVPALSIPIPLEDIRLLTLRPAKLLRLIAWELLGCAGKVVRQADSRELAWEASCDDLQPGIYNFVIAPGQNPGHVLNLADVYSQPIVSVDLRRHSTEPSVSGDTRGCVAEADGGEVIARRDGGCCIFSAFGNVTEPHIISKQTGMNGDYIEALSASRGFGFRHHRDPKNTLTLIEDLCDEYDAQEAFILATDPDFLTDEDIPLPAEEKQGGRLREQRQQPANTSYIWQSLPRFHCADGIARMAVAHNQRARFADPSLVEHLPSPAAINYIYVGALLKQYLPEAEKLRITAPERDRFPGKGIREAPDGGKRSTDGQFREGSAHQNAMQNRSQQEHRAQSSDTSSSQGTVSNLSPLELMVGLRREVAIAEEEMVERSKKASLANWLSHSG